MSKKKPRYVYGRDKNGCDDHWVVHDTKTGRDLAYSVFWDSHPDWMERTRADIRLIVDALNALPSARNWRAKP
ncbi:MAG TPA: hypothetical protein VHC22_34320 [Pirellulales bacterium]|nr:hypothetical protein [Pirellulales bacterium]